MRTWTGITIHADFFIWILACTAKTTGSILIPHSKALIVAFWKGILGCTYKIYFTQCDYLHDVLCHSNVVQLHQPQVYHKTSGAKGCQVQISYQIDFWHQPNMCLNLQ